MEAFQDAAFLCEEYYEYAKDIEISLTYSLQVFIDKGKKVGLSLVYHSPHTV